MKVAGAEGLGKLAGVAVLVPTAAIIEKVLKAIIQNGAELDSAATKAFGALVTQYLEAAPKAAETISKVFVKYADEIDANAEIRLLDVMRQIASLPVPEEIRSRLLAAEQGVTGDTRKIDHEALADIARIGAATVGAVLAIGSVAAGYKYARKPTWIEALLGKR